MSSFRSHVALVIAAVGMLTWSASAQADVPPPPVPPDTPSIDQYVETVPTSRGGSSAGVGKPRSRPLSPAVAAELGTRSNPTTQLLKAVATSSTYGAPQRDLPTTREGGGASESEAANPLSAAVSAVSDSGDSRVFWLLVGLVVVTTTMLWTAARRNRA